METLLHATQGCSDRMPFLKHFLKHFKKVIIAIIVWIRQTFLKGIHSVALVCRHEKWQKLSCKEWKNKGLSEKFKPCPRPHLCTAGQSSVGLWVLESYRNCPTRFVRQKIVVSIKCQYNLSHYWLKNTLFPKCKVLWMPINRFNNALVAASRYCEDNKWNTLSVNILVCSFENIRCTFPFCGVLVIDYCGRITPKLSSCRCCLQLCPVSLNINR